MNSKYDDGSTFIIGHGSNPLFLVQKSVQTSLICRSSSMSGFFLCMLWRFGPMYKGTLARSWAIVWFMSLSALSYFGLCQIWPPNPQYVTFWYWLLYFSNMILNTLHHVICRHLSTRYCAFWKWWQILIYSDLGWYNPI